MKIYKIGENKYYKGECENCGTGIICNWFEDKNIYCCVHCEKGFVHCMTCPNCNENEIYLVEITKEEYDELVEKSTTK